MSGRVNSSVNSRNLNGIDDITERMDDVRERLKQLDSFLCSNAAADSSFDDNTCECTKHNNNTYFFKNNKSNDINSDVGSTTTSLNAINNNSNTCSKAAHFRAQTTSHELTSTVNNPLHSQKEFALSMPKRKVALHPPRRRFAWFQADHNRNKTLMPSSHDLERRNIMPYSQSMSSNTSSEESQQQEYCEEEYKEYMQEKEAERHQLIVDEEECAEGGEEQEMSNLVDNEHLQQRRYENLQEKLCRIANMNNEKNDNNMPLDINMKENDNSLIYSKQEKSVNMSEELPSNIVEEMHHRKFEDGKTYNDSSNANSISKTVHGIEIYRKATECKENKPPLFLTRNLSGLYVNEKPFNLMEAVQKRLQRKQCTALTPLTEEHTKLTSLFETCLSETEKNYVEGSNNNYSNTHTEHEKHDHNNQYHVHRLNTNSNDDDNNENSEEESPESPVRDCSTETAAPEGSPKSPMLELQSEINNCQEEQLQHEQQLQESELQKELKEWKNVNVRSEIREKQLVLNSFNEESSHYSEEELTSPLHDATIKIKVTLFELLSLLEMRRWVEASATDNISLSINRVDNINRVYTLLVTSQEHAALLLQRCALHKQRTKYNYHEPICERRAKNDKYREAFSDTNNNYLYSGKSANSNRCIINKSTLHRKNVESNVCHSTKLNRDSGKQMRTRIPV